MQKFSKEKDMAPLIKRELDRRYSPTWHVIVGKVGRAALLPPPLPPFS